MFKNFARNFFAYFGLELRRNEILRKNVLGHLGVRKEDWTSSGSGYYLKLLDVTVRDVDSPLLRAYELAKKIALQGRGKFFLDEQQNLRLTISGTHFFINYPDELFVINEVFVEHSYNLKTTEQIIVVDVGMNIGATTLFFAQQENVRKVYSYELFPGTHNAALRNLALNDSSKVMSFAFGLGSMRKTLSLPYSPESKAIMGMSFKGSTEGFQIETVTIEDAAEVIRKIHESERAHLKLCKLDCEGAEFEILDRLFETESIHLIDFFLIEWHDPHTESIERQFLEHNFRIVRVVSGNFNTGLIYAFKHEKA